MHPPQFPDMRNSGKALVSRKGWGTSNVRGWCDTKREAGGDVEPLHIGSLHELGVAKVTWLRAGREVQGAG